MEKSPQRCHSTATTTLDSYSMDRVVSYSVAMSHSGDSNPSTRHASRHSQFAAAAVADDDAAQAISHKQACPISNLPEEVWLLVLSWSGSRSAATAASCCSAFRALHHAVVTTPMLLARALIVDHGPFGAAANLYGGPNGQRSIRHGVHSDEGLALVLRELVKLTAPTGGAAVRVAALTTLAAHAAVAAVDMVTAMEAARDASAGGSGTGTCAAAGVTNARRLSSILAPAAPEASCADVSAIFTIRRLASGILCSAAMAGHEHVVATALVLGASGMEKALVDASGAGRGRVVRLLLACGTDPNAAVDSFGPCALFKAASNGHTDVVQLLLDAGACVDSTCITAPPYNDRVAATVLRFDAPAAVGQNRSTPAYVWGQWPAMLSLDSHRRVGATTLAGSCGSSSGVFPPLQLSAPMAGSTVALAPPQPLPPFPPLSALSAPQLELQIPCCRGAVNVANVKVNRRMPGTLGALLTTAPSSTTAATATSIPLSGASTATKTPASAAAPYTAAANLQPSTATEADTEASTTAKTTAAAISRGLPLAVSTTATSAVDAVAVMQTPSSSAGDVTPAPTVPTTSTTAAVPSVTLSCDGDKHDFLAFGGGTATSSPRTPVRSPTERMLPLPPPPPPRHRKSPGLLPAQMPSLPLMPPLPKLPPLPNTSLPPLPPGATMSLLGPSSRFSRKVSLLLVACQGGHAAAAALLIRYGAKVDREGGSELVQAGHPDVVDELLASVPDLRVHLDQALVASASDNRLAVASALLRHGADPSFGGGLALQEAAFLGHTTVLKLLLESGGALLRSSGVLKSVLEMARKWCRPGVVQILADAASPTTYTS
ncbi:hypothetical protein VaNZ11_005867 [Volvox africanus]|uniref:F-box domain-containing protein n=1 Tax=Volvox africanus TaxID=51714 RepID=A0ABQ5S127_9CHLO|nr:hypothetical protein VaNZ11_005867 [Volvox africanus]